MSYNSLLQSGRQSVHRNDEYPGVIGDDNGNPYGTGALGTYWVRFPQGTGSDGKVQYDAGRPVRYGSEAGSITVKAGIEVLVRIDPYDGIETITRVDPGYYTRAQKDGRILNPAEPFMQFTDARNFIRLMCRPPGSDSGATSTLITVREDPFYVDEFMDWQQYAGTIAAASKLDVASLIPATDYHLLCVGWMDRYLNTPFLTISTAQALSTALDSTDYDECFADVNVHNECEPLAAFELADNRGKIDINDLVEDLRNWLPSRKVYGFPHTVPEGKTILIRETHQQVVYGQTVLGCQIAFGELVAL